MVAGGANNVLLAELVKSRSAWHSLFLSGSNDLYRDHKARFSLPELTGDRFPLPVNTARVQTGHPSTRAVNSGRQLG